MSSLYFCPTAREVESATGGGFDTCCAHPELHVPMPDNEATAAVSQVLSDAARREFQLQQQVARVRNFLEDMAGWCSPHGVAADYARRGLEVLDGVDRLRDARACSCGRSPDPGICEVEHSAQHPAGGHCACACDKETT